jgi:hypothetical protein
MLIVGPVIERAAQKEIIQFSRQEIEHHVQ